MSGARPAALLLACAALCGCARAGSVWSAEAAAARHLPLFDDDRDGAVSRAEYLQRRYTGPPFGAVDLDGDGVLGAVELLRLGRGQDA